MFKRRLSNRPAILSSAIRSLFFVTLAVLFVLPAMAQVTTGNLAGSVTDATGAALPGVTVEAVHTPTGTHYTTVTEASGRFFIANARVGGPYKVTGNLEGFKPSEATNVTVNLGTTAEVALKMQLSAVTESITVTARPDDIINPNRTGSTSTVSTEQIQALPTVNRSLQDFARTNPYFTVDARDDSQTTLNVAGRNNRYNNIQIDGAVNNDLFGLAATGTPGGQANTQPISIDAIDQIQLVVSPYDVRQGGFTGGGVNAVTRSGTNKISGSVFGTKRNESSVGKNVPVFVPANFSGDGKQTAITEKAITNFEYTQYGGRLGGAIIQDKLFFFVSGERNRKEQPDGTSADGTAGTNYTNGTQDAVCGNVAGCSAARLRQDLINKYSYDPGDLGDIPKNTPSNLVFVRADFNATSSNALTLRHNYVKGSTDIVSNRTTSQFRFPTSIYSQADTTNSTVAQLNSVISSSTFNEARIGYQTIKDIRNTAVQFPSIEIGGANQNATLNAGTERFSGANSLDQKVTEITDDFTWVRGDHTLVLGTHNEIFKFKNLFLSEFNGYYFYPTLKAFEDQDCSVGCEYRISYATGADPRRPTEFGATQYGFYASDQYHVSNDLTMVFGLRADKPKFDDTPSFNQIVADSIGRRTDEHPGEEFVFSPRVGFNWNPNAGGRQQLRGGIGVFAGRTPYVWISNAYAGTGVEQVALACRTVDKCAVPAFNPDPLNQPKLGAAGALSVDLVDPNFKFPRVLRATLGYDRDLFWGLRGSAELLYSKTQEDVYYQNLNYVRLAANSPLDGRPTYARATTKLVDATFLTNTNKGAERLATIQLSRPFSHGVTVSGNWAHQNARSAFDATSSRAISNWRFQHSQGDIFTPTLGRSAFEIKNRFTVNATYDLSTGPFTHSFGLFYNAQSGRPYSLLLGGDPNKDTNTSNDLLYIPGDPNNFILQTSQQKVISGTVLQDYLSAAGLDPSKARIINKYESFEPWSRHLDFHYALGLPVKFLRTEVTFDMLNLLHYFNKEYGNVYFVANQNVTPVNYIGQDATTGKPIYREASTTVDASGNRIFGSLTPGRQFSIADLVSRWQMRLGLRVSF
jgi:Carboxypeptidase regulatory-like domain/TonB-dependent Receptor Plug Domain